MPIDRFELDVSREASKLLFEQYRIDPTLEEKMKLFGGASVGFAMMRAIVKDDLKVFQNELKQHGLSVAQD